MSSTSANYKNADLEKIQNLSENKDNTGVYLDSSEPVLNPYFLTGFADGESSFFLTLTKNNRYKQGWLVFPTFQITLHQKDRALLESIRNYFNGAGSIFKDKKDSIKYRVASVNDLSIIMDHFDKYPLITQKQADYILFKQALELVHRKQHLTSEGLQKIVNIRASMNNGLTEVLTESFPNVTPISRPLVLNQEIKDPNWLAGFVSGEGCFYIEITKSNTHKIGHKILLKFLIGQHSRDAQLMESLITYLGCGGYTQRHNLAVFTVQIFSDISEKIIPFFFFFFFKKKKSKISY